jgi:hypothetical protein
MAGRPGGGAFNGGARYRRYGSAVKRLEHLLALLDPGWLFIIAGLAMCAAAIIVPAQADLGQLRQQVTELREEEAMLAARLRAHAGFLDDLHRGDSALVRRLAAAQLNVVPEGERPVLLVRSASASVADWIEATVREEPLDRPEPRPTVLRRLTEGSQRLWVLGGSVFCVFVGLLLSPSASRRRALHAPIGEAAARMREREQAGPVAIRFSPGMASSAPAEAAGDEALGGEEPAGDAGGAADMAPAAVACAIEPGVGQMLLTNDIDDEGDVLDEDEVEQPAEANGARTAANEPAPIPEEAGPAGDVDEQFEFEWGLADEAGDEPADGNEGEEGSEKVDEDGGGDEDEDEDATEDAGERDDCVVVMDEEMDCASEEVECPEAGDDADDGEYEYEYEYEYVYVDEPEEEGAEEDELDDGQA